MESKFMAIRDDVRNAGVKISRMLGPLSASEGAAARIAASTTANVETTPTGDTRAAVLPVTTIPLTIAPPDAPGSTAQRDRRAWCRSRSKLRARPDIAIRPRVS
jgi:hypothetical protein